jgi:hypothetical protein
MPTLNRPLGITVILTLVALSIIALASAHEAKAQSESGSAAIEGTVHDANGAAIAGAAINVRNVETGLARTATSSGNGDYNVPVNSRTANHHCRFRPAGRRHSASQTFQYASG